MMAETSDALAGERNGREPGAGQDGVSQDDDGSAGWLLRLWEMFRSRDGEPSLRDAIEEIIEESEREPDDDAISAHERVMLANILKLRHLTADDVSVPRADIVSIDIETGVEALIEIMIREGHSRLPVYRGTLDDVFGMVHIKDVLAHVHDADFDLKGLVRTVLFVAPSMPAMDILLQMRLERTHMALVVDEFGGIDGLVTIEDVVEEIVGEIEDEHDVEEGPKLEQRNDGSLVADARMTIDEFESRVGSVLTETEREEDLDTLGGLLAELAGHVPGRGELVQHASGITFEVLDADPRSVKRVRVRNAPPLRPDP